MTALRTVAALYVDPRGPYPKMAGVDCWDEGRDARLYAGPHPVVAHPPCGPWSKPHMCSAKTLRESLDCGPRAVEQVRRLGGVLEQPAGSKLWIHCELSAPFTESDGRGFSLEVQQVSWGHVACKNTWLYLVGIDRALAVSGVKTGGEPTHWVSGGRNPLRKNGKQGGGVVPPGIKVCSAQQRRRTPPLFAEWLVALARSVRP